MDEIMTGCNLEKNLVQKSTHEELQRTEPQFRDLCVAFQDGHPRGSVFCFCQFEACPFGYSSGQ